jgi:hypothetical protein
MTFPRLYYSSEVSERRNCADSLKRPSFITDSNIQPTAKTVLPNQCSSEPGDSQGKYIVYSNIFLHLSTTQTNMVCIQIVLNVTFVTLYGKVGSFYKETYGMKRQMI